MHLLQDDSKFGPLVCHSPTTLADLSGALTLWEDGGKMGEDGGQEGENGDQEGEKGKLTPTHTYIHSY